MAREKVKTRFFTVPEKLAAGLRFADVKKKVGEEKDCVFRVIVAEHTAEGLRAIITHYSSICGEDNPNGPVWAANILNSAIATSVGGQADPKNLDKAVGIVPKFQKFGEVNKAEVAGAAITEYLKANPNPSKDEFNAFVRDTYAGLTL